MPDKNDHKVTIKGKDLSFEQSVSLSLARRLVALAASGDTAPPGHMPPARSASASTPAPSTASQPDVQALSLAEYLAQHEAKRNIEKITAIGEYLKVHQSKGTFTEQDLIDGFEAAGEAPPGNLVRDITWAKKAGWLAEKSDQDGHYYVTNSGRHAIGQKFSQEVRAKSKASGGGRKKGSKNKKAAAT